MPVRVPETTPYEYQCVLLVKFILLMYNLITGTACFLLIRRSIDELNHILVF